MSLATTIFVPTYEWNAHYNSVEEAVEKGRECGDYQEGEEFVMVRLQVGAATTYKIVGGKPVLQAIAFPDAQVIGGPKPSVMYKFR